MGLLDKLKDGAKWTANKSGNILRGTAKGTGCLLELGGKIIGKPVELAAQGTGKLIALVNERMGDVVSDSGAVVGRSIEGQSKIISQGIQQGVNIGTGVVSWIAGDDEGELDADFARMDAWDDFKAHFSQLWEAAQSAADGFTGKKCYEMAKFKFERLNNEKVQKQNTVNQELCLWTDRVQKHLTAINCNRSRVDNLFRKFEQMSSAFGEWNIRNRFFSEQVQPKYYSFTKMQSYEEIFKNIDFDKSPFWSNIKGMATCGFLTESQAHEASSRISRIEMAFQEEIKKANEEIARYKKIEESLTFVKDSFDFFTNFYDSMLKELAYSVQLLHEARYLRDMFHFSNISERLNPYFLPERHLDCLLACDKLSRLLFDLSQRRYFCDSSVEILAVDYNRVRKYHDRVVMPLIEKFAA